MDLRKHFYLLGIIFLIIMLITMIASLIGLVLAIRKIKQVKLDLKARLAEKEQTNAGQLVKTVLPLLVSLGMSGGLKAVFKKLHR